MQVESGSFIFLVYPFLFEEDTFRGREEAFDRAEWGELGNPWKPQRKVVRDVLKHVGDYLNPPPGAPVTARMWDLDGNALSSPQGLGGGGDWRLKLKDREIGFRIDEVQLVLFHLGVGLLTLRVRPLSQDGADWLDLLHYARFADRAHSGTVRIERRVGIDPVSRAPKYEPLFPARCGGAARHPDGQGLLIEVIAGLLEDGRLTSEKPAIDGRHGWWREVFVPGQLLPFASLFVRGVPAEEVPPMLFRLQNFFHSRQQLYPSADDLNPRQPGLLAYADRQWFAFSLDGGAFVAFDPPDTPFFRETLPDHLADQYFLLFLLVLHQRFTLMKLSEDVSRHWRVEGETAATADRHDEYSQRERVFRRIRDGLLSFTARGHFVQVMQRQHHHRCYRRWQETFQIAELYAEVDHEVHEMHEYLLLERTEHLAERSKCLERRLDQIAMILGPPALILGYFDAVGGESRLSVLLWSIGGLAIGWLGWRAVRWGFRDDE